VDFVADLPVPHEDGSLISPAIDRTIEVIKEYDWHLDVKWIPRDRRAPGDAAFAVTYSSTGNHDAPEYVVMYVDTEEDMCKPNQVLEKLARADNRNGSVEQEVEASNRLVRERQRKQYEEEIGEANELAAAIWKSPKARYRHNGRVYE
jgi:hypothetical protein